MSIYNQRFGPYALQPYGVTMPFQSLSSGPPVIPNVVTPTTVNEGQVRPPGMVTPPGMQKQLPGGQQGGMRTAADFQDTARRGIADLTLGNIGQSFGLGLGLMGGTGALKTVGQLALSQLGVGSNPFNDLQGFSRVDPDLIAGITSNNPNIARGQMMAAMREQERRNSERSAGPRGATDSRSGQVRGGGTGSRSGGLTAGGPR